MNSQSYHQQEMSERIRRFECECEKAFNYIGHMKLQARSYLDLLSSEPRELKSGFLQCTRQLDEFLYHVTEFNLTASSLEHNASMDQANKTSAPTQNSNKRDKPRSQSNTWRSAETKDARTAMTKTLKNEDWREFRASHSSRNRSIEKNEVNEETTTDVREIPHDVFLHRKADGCPPLGLPPQPKLDPASVSKASIISANGAQVWLVFDNDLFFNLVQEMTEHYNNQDIDQDFVPGRVCAYYDEEDTQWFLRALYINSEEVCLVDTGECLPAVPSRLRPLHPRFCVTPPLAHLCYLADVDQTDDCNLEDKQTEFLKQFLAQRFQIKLKMDDAEDDDPSKPPAVYLFLEDGRTVNELLVQALASSNPKLKEDTVKSKSNPPDENQNVESPDLEVHNITRIHDEKVDEIVPIHEEANIDIDDELDYSKCPEYENAVEAVTGYSNRDEMDICKHFTGGEGCFKGHRCKKRHVMMHPDGWTLDRVSVATACRPAALPAPGARRKVKVTHVDATCRLFVHFELEDEPMSLADLVDEMTSAAADSKSLQLEAAPGELVSAQFTDGRYYRARVIKSGDRKTEVMYIDFGNTASVSNTDLRLLQPRWLALPVRAVPCRLAGVAGVGVTDMTGVTDVTDASDITAAEVLKQLALDKTMEAHIIARDYDELTVELLDDGFDVAQQLAAFTGVELAPYRVEDDSQRRCHLVPA